MFFLVGWHYVKQGFGVFIVLSARRGAFYAGRERLAILAHCFAGWALRKTKDITAMDCAAPPCLPRRRGHP